MNYANDNLITKAPHFKRVSKKSIKNIKLTLYQIKEYKKDELKEILSELNKIKVDYDSILHDPHSDLINKIEFEIRKRNRQNWVWVEFEAIWSGYNNNQERVSARHYRKIKKSVFKRLPNYFYHNFSDDTTNYWNIKNVEKIDKEVIPNYTGQIDDFLKERE